MTRGAITFAAGLLALLAAFAFKQAFIAIPDTPEVAAAGQFDANRAFARLERILGDEQPHPTDSPGSDGVSERLLAEMRAVGLQPRVVERMMCGAIRGGRTMNCARVRNLVATIGPTEGEHLLFVAHHDSVPTGPGAADDGIGVATMLEVAEQLRGQTLQRPVTFLFDDSEETGLLGAQAFLESDPIARRVNTLVNLEARGVEGPAIMFETSRPNAAAVNLYAAAAPRPVANSLSVDFYRLLPNLTDVTVLDDQPWTILNIAIIGDETRYHTAGDNLAALDRRSVLHMGEQALGAARAYASGEAPGGTGELIYTDILTRHLIALPLWLGLALLGTVVLLFGYAVVRRRAWKALLPPLGAVFGAASLAWAMTAIVQALRPGEFWRAYPIAMQVAVAAIALLAVVAALAVTRSTREQLRVASWLIFGLVGAAICLIAPGAMIYFLLAPLILLLGLLIERWRPGTEQIAAWIAAFVQLLTFLPLLALVDMLLSTDPGWNVAPFIVLAALPFVVELRPRNETGRIPLMAAAVAALAAWAAVLIVPAYSEDKQQIFTLEYVRDLGSNSARWAVYNDGASVPDTYSRLGEWERTGVPYARRQRWVTAAPVVEGATPRLLKESEQSLGAGRAIRLRVEMNGWDRFQLDLPEAARAMAMRIDGQDRSFGEESGPASIRCVGRSCDGFTFDLVVGSREPIDATFIGNVARLPEQAAPLLRDVPQPSQPQYVPHASYALAPVRL